MSSADSTVIPFFHIYPVSLVRDVRRAAEYFKDRLGFTVPRMWGNPPRFCIAGRGGVRVMLNHVDHNATIYPNADYDGRYDAYFDVGNADVLHDEFKIRGANIVCEPSDEPYGMREFSVRDADGHLLAFGHTPHQDERASGSGSPSKA